MTRRRQRSRARRVVVRGFVAFFPAFFPGTAFFFAGARTFLARIVMFDLPAY